MPEPHVSFTARVTVDTFLAKSSFVKFALRMEYIPVLALAVVISHGKSPPVSHSISEGNVATSKPSKKTAPSGMDVGSAVGLRLGDSDGVKEGINEKLGSSLKIRLGT